jgi:hypothetical protein
MGELQHFGQDWKCVDLSSNADRKINVWLLFEFEKKTLGEFGSRSFHEDNHYP